jgi:hypothetical protein
MKRMTIGLAAAFVLATGCAQADGKITITKAVWDGFQQYQTWLTSTGSGYYAITKEGDGGAGSGCPSGHCNAGTTTTADMAITQCEKSNPGRTCIVFAKNLDPVIDYTVGQ